jgi:mRNA-degrading endonuclease RelE of RelBE toxin-antitoxin system
LKNILRKMYLYKFSKKLEKVIFRLAKKNSKLYNQLKKKIHEIIISYDIDSYKNLKYGLKNLKRVHVGHFVLIFSFDKNKNLVLFEDFDHHDKIYKK